jgi:hypothetical protein
MRKEQLLKTIEGYQPKNIIKLMRLDCSSGFYLARHRVLKETLTMMERIPGRG